MGMEIGGFCCPVTGFVLGCFHFVFCSIELKERGALSLSSSSLLVVVTLRLLVFVVVIDECVHLPPPS